MDEIAKSGHKNSPKARIIYLNCRSSLLTVFSVLFQIQFLYLRAEGSRGSYALTVFAILFQLFQIGIAYVNYFTFLRFTSDVQRGESPYKKRINVKIFLYSGNVILCKFILLGILGHLYSGLSVFYYLLGHFLAVFLVLALYLH